MWRWLSWGDFLACKYLYLSWFISKKHLLLLNQYLQQVGTLALSPIMLPEPLLHVDNQQQQAPGPQFQQLSNHKIQFDVFWSVLDKQYRKKFFKVEDTLKKVKHSESLISFLKQCHEHKVIPKIFVIQHNVNERFSNSAKQKIQNSLKYV